jgi:hypothetical protein
MYDFRLYDDPDDRWGHAMAWWFGVAETLHAMDEDIPDAWQFRPSPMNENRTLADVAASEEWPDTQIAEYVQDGTYSATDLIHAGNVLSRYANILQRAGMAY